MNRKDYKMNKTTIKKVGYTLTVLSLLGVANSLPMPSVFAESDTIVTALEKTGTYFEDTALGIKVFFNKHDVVSVDKVFMKRLSTETEINDYFKEIPKGIDSQHNEVMVIDIQDKEGQSLDVPFKVELNVDNDVLNVFSITEKRELKTLEFKQDHHRVSFMSEDSHEFVFVFKKMTSKLDTIVGMAVDTPKSILNDIVYISDKTSNQDEDELTVREDETTSTKPNEDKPQPQPEPKPEPQPEPQPDPDPVPVIENKTITVEEVLDYAVIRQADDTLYVGTETIDTFGENGLAHVTYVVTIVDGVETARTKIATTVVTPTTDEVILYGTKERPTDNEAPETVDVGTQTDPEGTENNDGETGNTGTEGSDTSDTESEGSDTSDTESEGSDTDTQPETNDADPEPTPVDPEGSTTLTE